MLAEEFIAWFMRRKTSQYFNFADNVSITPPVAPEKPVHLYVHIPFCSELCPYCSFHRVLFREEETRAYFKALRQELTLYHEMGFRFSGVYFGGGTPTILRDELVATLELIHRLFAPEEISVETNPDRLGADLLAELRDLGVKRVSVGIQTFDDELLKHIGRYHKYGSGDELKSRLNDAKGIVPTLNADMIYNFPLQSRENMARDLEILTDVLPDQITFYPLMISDATRKKMTRIMGVRSLQTEKEYYELITEKLAAQYSSTSAWCFSRNGDSLVDEYIVNNAEYVGAGSGAFGLVGNAMYANTFSLEEYRATLSRGQLPLKACTPFSRHEMARYHFLMDLFGLRMSLPCFREEFGHDMRVLLGPELLFFRMLGALTVEGDMVRLTPRGQYIWVTMMREFFTGVDNFRDLSRKKVGINPVLD